MKKEGKKGGFEGDARFSSAQFDPRFARFPGGSKKKQQQKQGGGSKRSGTKAGRKPRGDRSEGDLGAPEPAHDPEVVEDERFADLLKNDSRFALGTRALKIDKRGKAQQHCL